MAPITYPFVRALLDERRTTQPAMLEIGCGAQQYRTVAGPGHIGLDVARSRQPPAVQASAELLPFAASSFDLVFGVATFCIVPDIDAALSECRRVLRPNGTLLIIDYQPAVLARLQAADPDHQHVWSATDLLARLRFAGLTAGHDLSDRFEEGRLKRTARRLRGGHPGQIWLVVEAAA